jgi:hypothetical protein
MSYFNSNLAFANLIHPQANIVKLIMRRGPRNFSKFGGFILVMTAAGLEMGSRVFKKVLPVEKITGYLLDQNKLAQDY